MSEVKESVCWNECEGNAGYKLISVANVELLLEKAIKLAVEDGRESGYEDGYEAKAEEDN